MFSLGASDGHVLFLLQSGHLDKAIDSYQADYVSSGQHDLEILQKMGTMILEQGFQTKEPETQLMTLFGAGVSFNERSLPILEDGLRNPHPQLQLVALHFLDRFQSDHADRIMNKALASNYLEIRLRAALYLARRKLPEAEGQITALMSKVESGHMVIFPEIYALLGTPGAARNLRKLLTHPDEDVRIQAILCAADYGRDDLLPAIRTMATHHSPAIQEACCWALGQLKDRSAVPKLQKIAQKGIAPYTQLAALHALVELVQDINAKKIIYELAEKKDLFAIHLLEKENSTILYKLIEDPDLQVRVNAVAALLENRDPKCLQGLIEILVRDARDLIFQKFYSPGEAFFYYYVIPSGKQNVQEASEQSEESIKIRLELLEKASELPEESFLTLAAHIFTNHQFEIIPILIEKIQNLNSQVAINFFKRIHQKAGSPLIREYCNLALLKLKDPGPYAQLIKKWVSNNLQQDLIQIPKSSFWKKEDDISPYDLSEKETSALLIEAFETLAQQQSDESISFLLEAIKNGNQKNRYVLAGLLLRAAQ